PGRARSGAVRSNRFQDFLCPSIASPRPVFYLYISPTGLVFFKIFPSGTTIRQGNRTFIRRSKRRTTGSGTDKQLHDRFLNHLLTHVPRAPSLATLNLLPLGS